jgi:hypothetical protein
MNISNSHKHIRCTCAGDEALLPGFNMPAFAANARSIIPIADKSVFDDCVPFVLGDSIDIKRHL